MTGRAKLRQHLDASARDFRYTLRGMRRSPGFATVAIATLALGIGANAAVVTTIARLLFHAPPGVATASTVGRLYQRFRVPMTHETRIRNVFSYSELLGIDAALPKDVALAGYSYAQLPLKGDGPVSEVGVTYVARSYFDVLGVRPILGRSFSGNERELDGATRVALISQSLWESGFGRRADVLGIHISIGSMAATVVGVLPRAFRGTDLEATDVWLPFNTVAADDSEAVRVRSNHSDLRLQLLVRGAPRQAAAAVAAASAALRTLGVIPDASAVASLAPLGNLLDPQRDKAISEILARLFAAACLVLLIACTNVAQLFVTRAMERKREIAIRFAVGMAQGRLMCRIAVESLTFAFVAALAAAAVCIWGKTALESALLPRVAWGDSSVGVFRAVTASAIIALVAAGLMAFVPMITARQYNMWSVIKTGEAGSRRRRAPVRDVLMCTQTALSFILLVMACLIIRSLQRVEVDWVGRTSAQVAIAFVPLDGTKGLPNSLLASIVKEDRARLRQVPGVDIVATMSERPVTGVMYQSTYLPGHDSTPRIPGAQTFVTVVSPGYFRVMGLRVLRGRAFDDDDRAGSSPVVMVSALMAREYWPGESPIGKCLLVHSKEEPCRTVIGVVEDTHAMKVREVQSMRYYLPLDQVLAQAWASSPAWGPHVILVRCEPGRLDAAIPLIQDVLGSSPGRPVRWTVQPFLNLLEPELRPWRLSAILFFALGGLAFMIAGVGIYGCVSYAARLRLRELAIRRALGGSMSQVCAEIILPTLRLIGAGVGIGFIGSVVVWRSWESLLYGISPADVRSYLGATAVLCVGALIACFPPILRVTRLNPTIVLAED